MVYLLACPWTPRHSLRVVVGEGGACKEQSGVGDGEVVRQHLTGDIKGCSCHSRGVAGQHPEPGAVGVVLAAGLAVLRARVECLEAV